MEKHMTNARAWEELQISNDFIFGKIMQDPKLCKGLLQRILPGLKIDRIEYPETQKAIRPDIDAKSVSLKDGTTKIFLNAKGTMDDVSPELKAFLDYVAGKKPADPFVDELEEAVKNARKNREWRHEYMTLLMRDQENIEMGMARGIIETGIDLGLSEGELLNRLQDKLNITFESAQEYLEKFGKQTV